MQDWNINIGSLILKSFISNPNFVGQVDEKTGEENTFQEMREKTVKCALWMQRLGIRSNDVIMICTNNQLEAYVPFIAALYIGAVVSPLDMFYNLEMIDFFVEQVSPVILFIHERFYKKVHKIINQLQVLKDFPTPIIIGIPHKKENVQTTIKDIFTLEQILNFNYDPVNIEHFSCPKVINVKSTAMKLFTSGTTAFPTQVDIPHLAFMAPSNQQAPNMRKNDTALLLESLCYINGIFMTIQAILLQVKVIRINTQFTARICEAIKKYKITWIFLEANLCNRLIKFSELEKHDVSSLRTVVFGGSTINSFKIHDDLTTLLPNASILQAYSLTETGIIAYQRQPGKMGSCGYVSADVQLKIVGKDYRYREISLGPERYGEIYCRSPYMLTAFLKHNSEQSRVILDWFKTGDVGLYDKDGDIYIVDRKNQIFYIRNHRVIPTIIENILLSHDAVLQAIVIPIPVNDIEHCMVAIIMKIPGAKVTEMEIRQLVVEKTSSIFAFQRVIFTNIWPCQSNGKNRRRCLLNMARSKYWGHK
ncbi:uncharacterized protein LOC126858960 isoform X2 [Cataglyphis hispanica]|nr:uncharacterized protein LOC126858960 isoform X2 [Cataglyphis hispanica]XP_050465696.1 uncharacterized protein LOC126858960 isoform X2 [Cataglyphis hispanica]